ncbi:MAG: hypothetical protein LBO06_03020 [Bacteroidales bacterium]|jgi:hypothetical protein|nr:hypothetical protein [Bacteroidales bacterium]
MERKPMFILVAVCMAIANSAFGQSETAYQSSEISFAGNNEEIELYETNVPVPDTNYKYRSPWASWAWSFFTIPGAGQFYNGNHLGGAIYLGCTVIAGSLWAIGFVRSNSYGHLDELNFLFYGVIGSLIYIGAWAASWITAPIQSKRLNAEHGLLSWQIGKKSNLALSPDIKLYNNILPVQNTTSTFGMKVSINF